MNHLCVVSRRACQDLLDQRVQKESLVHRFPFSIIFQSHHLNKSYICVWSDSCNCCLPILTTFIMTSYCFSQEGAVLTHYSKTNFSDHIGLSNSFILTNYLNENIYSTSAKISPIDLVMVTIYDEDILSISKE